MESWGCQVRYARYPSGQERLKEAAKHGFTRAIVPKANAPKDSPKGMTVIGVTRLDEALNAVFD